MKAQHIPGPWIVCRDSHEGDYKIIKPDSMIGTVYIAQNICQGRDEGRADAHLIAAAPDMLDALEGLRDMLLNHRGDDSDETPLIDKAFAAINKAKGL